MRKSSRTRRAPRFRWRRLREGSRISSIQRSAKVASVFFQRGGSARDPMAAATAGRLDQPPCLVPRALCSAGMALPQPLTPVAHGADRLQVLAVRRVLQRSSRRCGCDQTQQLGACRISYSARYCRSLTLGSSILRSRRVFAFSPCGRRDARSGVENARPNAVSEGGVSWLRAHQSQKSRTRRVR